MKRKVAMLLVFAMAVSMLGGCGGKKTYACSVELGENYVFDAAKIFGVSEKEAENYVANLTTLDTTKEGKYEVKVSNGKEEFIVKYTVKDTKDPVVNVKSNVLFTKSIDIPNYEGIVEVRDGSECTLTLCKFKKLDNIKVLDEKAVAYYDASLTTQTTEELLKRTDDLPDGEGVYSAVLLVEDAYRHKVAKELIVVYDTQAPVVAGMESLVTEITVDDITAEWTDTLLGNLSITDNVDGIISPSMMQVEMTKVSNDNTKHEVTATYTDRAGNEAGVKYTITLKEKANASQKPDNGGTATNKNPNGGTASGNGSGASNNGTTNNNGTAGNGNTSNGGGSTNNGGNTGNGGTTGSGGNTSNGGNTNTGGTTGGGNNDTPANDSKPPQTEPGYSYEDRDGDGYADLADYTIMNGFVVSTKEQRPDAAKFYLNLAENGWYNVVYDEYIGGTYGVLVEDGDEATGFQMLNDYLASIGLSWHGMDGGYFDRDGKAYMCVVYPRDIVPLTTNE